VKNLIGYKLFIIGIMILLIGSCSEEEERESQTPSESETIIPTSSGYNENIEWENVFTDGPPGKVNRAVVDSDGNAVVIFMPDNQSRIHKIDGNTGERIWTVTIDNTVGFGISEIKDAGRSDYIASGGIGETQERWVARLNGDDGSTMWSKTYNSPGEQYQFDAVRMTI
jgi:outer membrane protein assembly factor BamB